MAPAPRARASAPASPVPTARGERIERLDALRGFALFGILVVNLAFFSLYIFVPPDRRAALPWGELERGTRFVIELLFHGKFYALFSLLFGIGFAIQLERAAVRGGPFLGAYARRLLILLAIGVYHLMQLWVGDILTLYALLGFLLIPFRRTPGWVLLAVASLLFALPILQAWLEATQGFDPAAPLREAAARANGLGHAGRRDLFSRFAQIVRDGREWKVLGMFLIGLWIGRRRILHDPGVHRGLLRGTLLVGLPVGLLGGAAMGAIEIGHPAATGWGPVASAALYALGVYPLALAYAAGGALLGLRAIGRTVNACFAPAGRMALTNYLLQTVIANEIYDPARSAPGWTQGPVGWILLAIVIFAAQVVASALWLAVFRYGPVEWIWRQLTYLRPLPILRPRDRSRDSSDGTTVGS